MNIITVPPLIEYSTDDQLQMNIHIQCSIQMIVLYNLNLI